jgi:hypothetical protein
VSGSDAYSDRTLHSRTMDPHSAPANNIWRRLFQSPVSVTKLPWRDPLSSGSTMSLEKQMLIAERGNPTTLPISWRGLGKKWVLQMLLPVMRVLMYFPIGGYLGGFCYH